MCVAVVCTSEEARKWVPKHSVDANDSCCLELGAAELFKLATTLPLAFPVFTCVRLLESRDI